MNRKSHTRRWDRHGACSHETKYRYANRQTWLGCWLLLGISLSASVGCKDSPYEFAPVSGTVKLDGQPLAKARVVFLPKAKGKALIAGPDSWAMTDESGHFQLATADGLEGAVVGPHRVRISTYQDESIPGTEGFRVTAEEVVPPRYNVKTELTVEVPAQGKDDCLFDLQSD